MICTAHPIFSGVEIEKNEMGGICRAYGGEKGAYTGFWKANLRKRHHLGNPGLEGRIILKLIFRKCDVGLWTVSS